MQTQSQGIDLEQFIKELHELAAEQFPVKDVSRFFKSRQIKHADLAPFIHFSSDKYTRNLIYKNDSFALILICWQSGQRAPAHGHEGQKCWMRVQQGILRFSNFDLNPDQTLQLRSMVVGSKGYVDGPAVIHAVENRSDEHAISLHLYATPFEVCDVYTSLDGLKKKCSLKYDTIYGKKLS